MPVEIDKVYMPYCYVELETGQWLALNRRYKPIGTPGLEHVDYEKYRCSAVQFQTHPTNMRGVWTNEGTKMFYLYSDSPLSKQTYKRRLSKLVRMIHV